MSRVKITIEDKPNGNLKVSMNPTWEKMKKVKNLSKAQRCAISIIGELIQLHREMNKPKIISPSEPLGPMVA